MEFEINVLPVIADTDLHFIMEMVGDFANILISDDPLAFSDPNFHSKLIENIFEIVSIQIAPVYTYDIDAELELILNESLRIFFLYICPSRSCNSSTVFRKPNIEIIGKTIDYLIGIPQPDQRTEEWHKFRHMYLTASNIWKAFATDGAKNQLIYSKCIPIDTEKYDNFNLDSPLHWGQKYEHVSVEWYEKEYSTKISDFGCIPHSNISFLAASPDGIITDSSSCRYGRMIEVKNIVNREITGIPKQEYWIQMQMQMEVCNLDECDFIETRFTEYDDIHAFNVDGTFTTTADGKLKGIMMLFLNTSGQPFYEYAPIGIDENLFLSWNESMMDNFKERTWLKNIYWQLNEVSVVLVNRNRLWFAAAKPVLEELWKTIEYERIAGCEHRAPKKRHRAIINTEIVAPKCLIEIPYDIINVTFNLLKQSS